MPMPIPTAEPPNPRVYRLTVAQYDRMARAAILDEDEPVELLEGQLVTKMTKNERHIAAVKLVEEALRRVVPHGWHVAKEDPVALPPHDEPEPDLSVIRGSIRDYLDRKPGPSDVALVVEVADASYAHDRTRKQAIYAAAGIAAFWLVDLNGRRVEVFHDPTPRALYRSCRVFGPDDSISWTLPDSGAVALIPVADLLP